MKLIEKLKKTNKKEVYEYYCSLNTEAKAYEKITRIKMAEFIYQELTEIKTLGQLLFINELELLKDLVNHNFSLSLTDVKEYSELLDLNYIYYDEQNQTIGIFEELQIPLKEALSKLDWDKLGKLDNLKYTLKGIIELYGTLTKANLNTLIEEYQLTEIAKKCFISRFTLTLEIEQEEVIVPKKYELKGYEILTVRKRLGYSLLKLTSSEYQEFAQKGNVKAQELMEKAYTEYSFEDLVVANHLAIAIDFYDVEALEKLKAANSQQAQELQDIFNNSRSAALGGRTPLELQTVKKKTTVNKITPNHFKISNQDMFYQTYFALLDFTNDKFNLVPGFSMRDIEKITPEILNQLREALFNNAGIIKQFILNNPANLSKKHLKTAKCFRWAKLDNYLVIKHEKEFTCFVSDEQKYYAVNSLKKDLNGVILTSELPLYIRTVLVSYEGKIYYDGIINELPEQPSSNKIQEIQQAYRKYRVIKKF